MAWTDDIPDLKPVPITIFQRHFVLFRDPVTSLYVVMDDMCPHRAAPLSEGRLFIRKSEDAPDETILECGYHGWRFDCTGRCVDIPVAELTKRIPETADIGGLYATAVSRQGLVFMFWGDRKKAGEVTVPVPPELEVEDDGIVFFRNSRRRFPISAPVIMENVADPAHVPWSHHGTGQGDRNKVGRDGGGVVEEDRVKEGYMRARFMRSKKNSKGAAVNEVKMPTYVGYRLQFRKIESWLMTWVLPVSHNECVMFSGHAFRGPWMVKLITSMKPRWWEHMTANLILDGDSVLLQGQENRLQGVKRDAWGGGWKELYTLGSGSWDVMVERLRRFFELYGDSMPYVGEMDKSHKVLSREYINDRYEMHTKDCGSCAVALKNVKTGIVVALVVAGMCGLTMVFGVVLLAVLEKTVDKGAVWRTVAGSAVVCASALWVAKVLNSWREKMTYTTVSYDLAHAD